MSIDARLLALCRLQHAQWLARFGAADPRTQVAETRLRIEAVLLIARGLR